MPINTIEGKRDENNKQNVNQYCIVERMMLMMSMMLTINVVDTCFVLFCLFVYDMEPYVVCR